MGSSAFDEAAYQDMDTHNEALTELLASNMAAIATAQRVEFLSCFCARCCARMRSEMEGEHSEDEGSGPEEYDHDDVDDDDDDDDDDVDGVRFMRVNHLRLTQEAHYIGELQGLWLALHAAGLPHVFCTGHCRGSH